MAYPKLSTEILSAAIQGFEQQKLLIDDQIAELRAMMSGDADESPAAPGPITKTRRKMSAAARKRMGDAQRKRWSASKDQSVSPSPATSEGSKPKRKLSAAGKAAIVAALKKRWAARKTNREG